MSLFAIGDRILKQVCIKLYGKKCELCGNENDVVDNHHVLPKSVYPQHRYNPLNIMRLCRSECHRFAEDQPKKFLATARRRPKLVDRIMFHDKNKGVGKYPTEVNYENDIEKLKEML